jgi:Beta-lactamase enzyme family
MPKNKGQSRRNSHLLATDRIYRRVVTLAGTMGLTAAIAVGAAPSAVASADPATRPPTGTNTLAAPSRSSTGAGTSTGTVSADDLGTKFRAYLAGRPGQVSVAVFDAGTGSTVNVTTANQRGWETASTVKLDILVALLAKAGPGGHLTAAQQALARPMISVSDNASASQLWNQLGGATAMTAFFGRLGMTATTAGSGGQWGLTRTTAADQLAVLRAVAYPNGVLSAAARTTAVGLLRGVVGSQRWGLTAGVPAGVAVEVKNGWLPHDGGWVISSLAHVHGGGRDYVMAAYTRDSPSMAAGIQTVEGLSRLAWASGPVRRG